MAWIEALSTTAYVRDVLLLAGDVSDDLAVLERTLALLTARFAHVFFVPGNHECAEPAVRMRPRSLTPPPPSLPPSLPPTKAVVSPPHVRPFP